jgi:hypothetical protein
VAAADPAAPASNPGQPKLTVADIPAGDPAAVAARLLHQLRPGVADETASRIAHLQARIEDAVERTRLGDARLNAFIDAVAPLVIARDTLTARVALAAGGDVSAVPPAEAVADLVL